MDFLESLNLSEYLYKNLDIYEKNHTKYYEKTAIYFNYIQATNSMMTSLNLILDSFEFSDNELLKLCSLNPQKINFFNSLLFGEPNTLIRYLIRPINYPWRIEVQSYFFKNKLINTPENIEVKLNKFFNNSLIDSNILNSIQDIKKTFKFGILENLLNNSIVKFEFLNTFIILEKYLKDIYISIEMDNNFKFEDFFERLISQYYQEFPNNSFKKHFNKNTLIKKLKQCLELRNVYVHNYFEVDSYFQNKLKNASISNNEFQINNLFVRINDYLKYIKMILYIFLNEVDTKISSNEFQIKRKSNTEKAKKLIQKKRKRIKELRKEIEELKKTIKKNI